MEEIWKSVKDYEGLYEVSNLGRVKSLDRYVNSKGNKPRKVSKRILKQTTIPSGYCMVWLSKNYNTKPYLVHRLVSQEFIPNPYNKSQVNHINGVKSDNKIINLEWVNKSENMIHSYNNNLHKSGQYHHKSKLLNNDVLKIRELLKTKSYTHKKIGEMFNVSRGTISLINKNSIWKHI